MKKILIIIASILMTLSCTNKYEIFYENSQILLEDVSDPLRYVKVLKNINNVPRKEYMKHKDEFDILFSTTFDEYQLKNKEKFLAEYGKTSVAFVEDHGKLFIMNLDGTEKEEIVSGSYNGKRLFIEYMRWSPDGKRIVFNSALNNSSIMYVDIETKQITQITDNVTDSWPNWSPDSTKIIFFRETYNRVISYDIKTNKESILFEDWDYAPLCPFYLPNGEDIAFNRKSELQILRKGQEVPETLLKAGKVKNSTSLVSALATGAFEYGVSSNTGKYYLVFGEQPMIYNMNNEFTFKTSGLYGTFSHDDKYIMYNSTKKGKWGFFVTPMEQISDEFKVRFLIDYGKDAIWSPVKRVGK